MLLGSTRTLVTLLRPCIKRFTMIISAWLLRTRSKFACEEVKRQLENLENGRVLSGCGFVRKIAPPSLPREWRIKMRHSISQCQYWHGADQLSHPSVLRAFTCHFFRPVLGISAGILLSHTKSQWNCANQRVMLFQ